MLCPWLAQALAQLLGSWAEAGLATGWQESLVGRALFCCVLTWRQSTLAHMAKLNDFHWWADQVSIRRKAFLSISLTACNFEYSGQNCRLIMTRGQCTFPLKKAVAGLSLTDLPKAVWNSGTLQVLVNMRRMRWILLCLFMTVQVIKNKTQSRRHVGRLIPKLKVWP